MAKAIKKILIVTSAFPRWMGDFPGFFIFELAERLIQRGYLVTVLAPDDGSTPIYERMAGIKVVRFSYFWPRSLQCVCYGSGIPDNLRHSWLARFQFPFFVFFQLIALIRLFFLERPHIINPHWIVVQGLTCAIVKFFNRSLPPIVMTIHAAGVFALNRTLGGKFIARFIVNRCCHIFAVSSYVRDTLQALVGREIPANIVPMGIDVDEFHIEENVADSRKRYGLRPGKMLLYIGRLAHKKGINYLIDALPTVVQEAPDTYLTVIGGGHLEDALQEQVRKLGLTDHVYFMGAASHDQIAHYLYMADLVVIPSIIDTGGQTEGMPVVLMEALAAGKPVVASAVSGMRDALHDGKNGFLSRPRDSRHLASQIIRALNQNLDKVSAAAYESGRQYDWEKIIDHYQAVFGSIGV